MQTAWPTSSFGYYRGSPQFQGQGSNQGVSVSGNGVFAPGQGTASSGTAWSPTIMYLFALVVAEMIIFGILSRHV
jgi:hypothetical protein